jgi:hypothetical protein
MALDGIAWSVKITTSATHATLLERIVIRCSGLRLLRTLRALMRTLRALIWTLRALIWTLGALIMRYVMSIHQVIADYSLPELRRKR